MIFALGIDETQFTSLHPRLQALALFVDFYTQWKFRKEVLVTSMIRKGDPGVHGVGRGIDLRSRDFFPNDLNDINEIINRNWTYGKGKPTCLIHDVGQGMHIHLQVPA